MSRWISLLLCVYFHERLCVCSVWHFHSACLSVPPPLQKESVALAERLIDESEIRGYQLHVEAARFELKGQYDASKKKKKSKDYRKRMKAQQKYVPS